MSLTLRMQGGQCELAYVCVCACVSISEFFLLLCLFFSFFEVRLCVCASTRFVCLCDESLCLGKDSKQHALPLLLA